MLLLLPGMTEQFITVAILGDKPVEPNETFLVDLTHPINATLIRAQAVGTILNDDGPQRQTVDFGLVPLGEQARQQVTIRNPGPAPLDIRSVSLAGPDSDAFALENPVPWSIGAGSSGTVTITFQPKKPGLQSNRLLVASQDPLAAPIDILLTGDAASAESGELRVFAPRLTGNSFEFSFLAAAGRGYVVEYRDSFGDSGWKELSRIEGAGSLRTLVLDAQVSTQRFYRVRQQ